jgi:hypothetical protein
MALRSFGTLDDGLAPTQRNHDDIDKNNNHSVTLVGLGDAAAHLSQTAREYDMRMHVRMCGAGRRGIRVKQAGSS